MVIVTREFDAPRDLVRAVKKAIDAGLAREDARAQERGACRRERRLDESWAPMTGRT